MSTNVPLRITQGEQLEKKRRNFVDDYGITFVVNCSLIDVL